MSDSSFPSFYRWGQNKSVDEATPDVIVVEPTEVETFETEYTINFKGLIDGTEYAIPLQSFESKNKQLLQKWNDAMNNAKIQVGKKFKIKTWKATSKNNRPIRRFELVT